jgi:hypothetical protein
VVRRPSVPSPGRLSLCWWAHRVARQCALHVGAPTAPDASADRSDSGAVAPMGPQRPCWRVLVCVRRRRGGPSLALRAELLTVSEAHQVVVPHGLKVPAPEPDFEPGGEGVRAAHGVTLTAVLGANHHRERVDDGRSSAREPYGGRQLSVAECSPDTN